MKKIAKIKVKKIILIILISILFITVVPIRVNATSTSTVVNNSVGGALFKPFAQLLCTVGDLTIKCLQSVFMGEDEIAINNAAETYNSLKTEEYNKFMEAALNTNDIDELGEVEINGEELGVYYQERLATTEDLYETYLDNRNLSDTSENWKNFLQTDIGKERLELHFNDFFQTIQGTDISGTATEETEKLVEDGQAVTYSIKFSPAIIFSGTVPAFDVNFVSSSTVTTEADASTTEAQTAIGIVRSSDGFDDLYTKLVENGYVTKEGNATKTQIRSWFTNNVGHLKSYEVNGKTVNCSGLTPKTWRVVPENTTKISVKSGIFTTTTLLYEANGSSSAWQAMLSRMDDNTILSLFDNKNLTLNETPKRLESVASKLKAVISKCYTGLQLFAIVGLLSVLVYIAIRIIIGSVGEKSKYKQMLMDWLAAICILFILLYLMAFILNITQSITNILTVSTISENGEDILMTNIRNTVAQDTTFGSVFGETVIYVMLVFYTCSFTIKYLQRVVYMAFLTMIAPLIALTYPLDKIKDSKAQAFNMWLKEYIFNAMLQPVHLLLYYILLGSSTELLSNPLYAIVAIAFLSPAEKFFRKMFKMDSRTPVGQLGAAAAGATTMNLINKMKMGGKGGAKGKAGAPSTTRGTRTADTNPLGALQISNPDVINNGETETETGNENGNNPRTLPNLFENSNIPNSNEQNGTVPAGYGEGDYTDNGGSSYSDNGEGNYSAYGDGSYFDSGTSTTSRSMEAGTSPVSGGGSYSPRTANTGFAQNERLEEFASEISSIAGVEVTPKVATQILSLVNTKNAREKISSATGVNLTPNMMARIRKIARSEAINQENKSARLNSVRARILNRRNIAEPRSRLGEEGDSQERYTRKVDGDGASTNQGNKSARLNSVRARIVNRRNIAEHRERTGGEGDSQERYTRKTDGVGDVSELGSILSDRSTSRSIRNSMAKVLDEDGSIEKAEGVNTTPIRQMTKQSKVDKQVSDKFQKAIERSSGVIIMSGQNSASPQGGKARGTSSAATMSRGTAGRGTASRGTASRHTDPRYTAYSDTESRENKAEVSTKFTERFRAVDSRGREEEIEIEVEAEPIRQANTPLSMKEKRKGMAHLAGKVLKKSAGKAIKFTGKTAGKIVFGTLGIAAGATKGDFSDTLTYGVAAATIGGSLGERVTEGIGNAPKTGKRIINGMKDIRNEAVGGKEYAQNERFDREFFESEKGKKLLAKYPRNNIQKCLASGITDGKRIEKILELSKNEPDKYPLEKAIAYSKLEEKCDNDILLDNKKFTKYLESLDIPTDSIKEIREGILKFRK